MGENSAYAILKLFYPQSAAKDFIDDVESLVGFGKIEMIHVFVKPCTTKQLTALIGADAFYETSLDFQKTIEQGERDGTVLFFWSWSWVYTYSIKVTRKSLTKSMQKSQPLSIR